MEDAQPSSPHDAAQMPWARESRLPLIGHCYDWPREVVAFWNKAFGPSRRYQELTPFLPRRHCFHEIEPQVRLAFLGDVLPGCGRTYRLGEGVRRFLAAADYLVLNLEGVICDRSRVVNAVRHEPWILDFLADLFPPSSTILLCANNHAADCGWEAFKRSCAALRERGFRVLGRRDEPSLLLPEGVQLANGTEWLNVRHPYIARLPDADNAWSDAARFRIFCSHWGTEMILYPWPSQIARARRLLGRWDMIVGHHPHCPQPIAEESGKFVAYSLGNFARGDASEKGWHGQAVQAAIGPDASGRWRLGETKWTFTIQRPQPDGAFLIDTAERCRFFAV